MLQVSFFFFPIFLISCVTQSETKKHILVFTSEEEDKEIGREAYLQTLAKEKISENKKWNDILQRVGQRIAAKANKPNFEWEFKLLESNKANAFCLPGGKVAVYTGIVNVMQSESGMAVVLSHEIAHAVLRHGAQRMARSFTTQMGTAALSALINSQEESHEKKILFSALGLGVNLGLVLPFSREHETEADTYGLKLMAFAGYDPKEAPLFWDRFEKISGDFPEFLSTHPSSNKRQFNLQQQLRHVLPLYEKSPKYGKGEDLIVPVSEVNGEKKS